MKASGDRVIGGSGDRKNKRTAGTRRRGEELAESDTGSYQGTGFSRAVRRKFNWALASALFRTLIQTLRAALREIFDESAYDRFLLRAHASRSVASYRAFTRERDAAMVKKPRCC
jgi:hypothetical protein